MLIRANGQLPEINLAIIDLYDNEPNEGMRCIRELIMQCNQQLDHQQINYKIYDTRYKNEIPNLSYDIYISSGGPGSPFDGEGTLWERRYFDLIDRIWNYNQQNVCKKHVFFICHSFQMMCRFFELATIRKRNFRSFGVIPVAKTAAADSDPLLHSLPEPYYAADFRQFEVIEPRNNVFAELNATILSNENERVDPAQQKALMAVRISDEIFGTQYHPEADPDSMLVHFRQPERQEQVVAEYGEERYFSMIEQLDRPDTIRITRSLVLPGFLLNAVDKLNNNCPGAP